MKIKSMALNLIIVSLFVVNGAAYAGVAKSKSPTNRKPSGQTCVTFTGDGAKKTFSELFPFTQGKVTTITATTNADETDISTENIFCRVHTTNLSADLTEAQAALKSITADKFQCGYYISSDGNLTPCLEVQ